MKFKSLFIITNLVIISCLCSVQASADDIYDRLFPTYIESCAGTQEKPLKGPPGGIVGHGFVYIRGACKDGSANYPRLRACTANDESQGVGLSVDQVFYNVNWVAIDDRELFFNGSINSDQPLDEQAKEKAVQLALEKRLFKNIKIRPEYAANFPRFPGESDEEWLAREGIGTNYAIGFHRSILCSKIPITQDRLEKVITYANGLNMKHFETDTPYVWSQLGNNCTHFVHNVLAAAGILKFKKIDAPLLSKIFNFAIPVNEWISNQRYATGISIEDLGTIYRNSILRKNLMNGWLPMQPGAVMEFFNIHDYKNSIADTNPTVKFIGIPYIGFNYQNMKRSLNNPMAHDLETNLLGYKKSYEKILSSPPSLKGFARGSGGVQLPYDFDLFYKKYIDYVKKELITVNEKLENLCSMKTCF